MLSELKKYLSGVVTFFKTDSRRWIVFSCAGVGFFVVLFLAFYNSPGLSGEFLAARSSASAVSREIVALTSQTNEKIQEVNSLDLRGDAKRARELIRDARSSNQLAYQRAFELSQYLQKLTESLDTLSSSRSQQLVYEAVAVELGLVTEFISYTQSLNVFFDHLERALVTNLPSDRKTVEEALSGVNERTSRINNLNEEFLAKMRQFDESL